MELHREYVEFLENEVKALEDELVAITELPDVDKLRSRIKKDKRDTQAMIELSKDSLELNKDIKAIKIRIRGWMVMAKLQLGRKVGKSERQVICIVCQEEKPESEMDENNICKHCRTMGSE